MYINVFTKNAFQEAGIEVVNIPVESLQKPLLYSTGIHPWDIQENKIDILEESFFITAAEKSCIAIGECGLDKSFEKNYGLQVKLFIQQVKTANLLKKPLIIYAFKAWEEITDLLNTHKNKVPVIVLFDSIPESVEQLKQLKDYYIAFNKHICLQNETAIHWIKNTSSKKILFYNTDESVSIKGIYQASADILKIDIQTLQHQILENFYKAFMLEKLPL